MEETDAVFPQKDPQYDPEKEQKYLEQVKTKRLPQLEKQRLKYLSEDFDPGHNWWGSENGITSTQSDRKSTRLELHSLMRISYAAFCSNNKTITYKTT